MLPPSEKRYIPRMARAGKLWTEDDVETMALKTFRVDVLAMFSITRLNHIFRRCRRHDSCLRMRKERKSITFMWGGCWEGTA